ncbi:folliculin-interacting protein N-terminus-domain-containing protein [Xylogone sp. PMI_703]|nr:folliculin-interacting protein N-terminus-domain-containing protein [Xylogone sp. PMI_703]
MSLLGKLFSTLPSTTSTSTSRPQASLDSNLEDHFTYNLLFPDAEALYHHDQVFSLSQSTVLTTSATNAFDCNPEFDLETRDVRVIIMQEATPASGSAYLLYDSLAPPPLTALSSSPPPDRQQATNPSAFASRENRRSISSPRKSSIGQNGRPVVIQPQESAAPRGLGGAFDRRSVHMKGLSYTETEVQRSQREYREEITSFSNCIFGTSEVLAYKGTGTKVHILPSESKPSAISGSYIGDGTGSLGRSSYRSSRLAQSYTSENVGFSVNTGSSGASYSSRGSERKKILITRMFPVPLPSDEDGEDRTPTPQKTKLDEEPGYPFPNVSEMSTTTNTETEEKKTKKRQPKQKRTPMYAVGLVIQLPPPAHSTLAPGSRSSFRGPSSYNEQESCASSYNSARRAGWTMLGNGFGVESLDSSISSDVDDRLDTITQHWDIIMRTLSHLQTVATVTLLPMLKLADINSPEPRPHMRTPSASISISGKRVEESKSFKLPKTTVKMIQLTSHCLMQAPAIQKEVDLARHRIVQGIKANQVVTGQGRWGIWREEARWVGKWACGKEEGFFFYNLLTAFLGNHTEWLQALGPTWYRRRHYQQQRTNRDDDISLPARTVIVSDDKMAARRLIFLLSAFLPANSQLSPALRFHRPSTSTSFGGFSQSPPSGGGVPILREESLRRKMNKRLSKPRASHTRTMSFPAQMQQSSHTVTETRHAHRPSDASIKTANLPIPGSDMVTRKSSAATTSTVTPVTTVSHFSTRRPIRGTGPIPRPGSSGSLAADDLMRSLKRSESTGHHSNGSSDSHSNSRWGSMISGFWSGRRRDSTATTDYSPSIEGVEIHDPYYKGEITGRGKLAKMVKEVANSKTETTKAKESDAGRKKSESGSTGTAKVDLERPADETPEPVGRVIQRIPDPSGAFESPVKTSINDDGVIDIDVPLPEYLSFETAVSSPSSSGYLSTVGFTNGLEGFEHYSRCGPETETALNVAGWLQRFHPDFALQAVPVQENLLEEIKASMRAEPTPIILPTSDNAPPDRWVDICSTIIADTTNFTIKHLRYQRFIKAKSQSEQSIPSLAGSFETTASRYGNPYSYAQLTPALDIEEATAEDRFIDDVVISMDETLIDAVERIMAQSGQSSVSKTSSACSSRSASRPAGSRDRSDSDAAFGTSSHRNSHSTLQATPAIATHRLEVPRNECKKMVLGALEEIVREVAESRKEHGGNAGRNGETLLSDERPESLLREGIRAWLANIEAME